MIDGTELVGIIAGGTTDYFAEFSPILFFVLAIVITFGIFEMILNTFFPRKDENLTNDNNTDRI